MQKRYTVKRGQRSALQYDVLLYEGNELRFVGNCYPTGKRRLKSDELRIIEAIKRAVEELT